MLALSCGSSTIDDEMTTINTRSKKMHDDGIIRVCLCRDAHKYTVKGKTSARERERKRDREREKKLVGEKNLTNTNNDDRFDDNDDVRFPSFFF